MSTTRIQKRWFAALVLTLQLVGCGKRLCQQPLAAVPQSISDLQWRLVTTTDPELASEVSSFNYEVLAFTGSFSGTITPVLQNQTYKDQANPFVYTIPRPGVLCLDDQGQSREGGNSSAASLAVLCQNGSSTINIYRYNLSRQGLALQDLHTGARYGYVENKGAIAPDNQCTFGFSF
jgi:hypothetical protein